MSDYAFNRKTMILEVPFRKKEGCSPFTIANFSGVRSLKHYQSNITGKTFIVHMFSDEKTTFYHSFGLDKVFHLEVYEHSNGDWEIEKKDRDDVRHVTESFNAETGVYKSIVRVRPKHLNKRKYLDHWSREIRTMKEGDTAPVIEEWYRVSNSRKQTTLGNVRVDINSRLYECDHFIKGTKEQAIAQLSQMKKEDMPEWKFGYIQTTLKTLQDFDEEAFVADMKAG